MGNFNRDSSRGGRRGGFGGGRSFGGRGRGGFGRNDRGPREMFNVTCSNCGKDAQVPFKPTGDKPVYCSDCFEKMGGKNDRKSFGDRGRGDRGNSNGELKVQLESLNAKLDKIISLLEVKAKPAKIKKSPEEVSLATEEAK